MNMNMENEYENEYEKESAVLYTKTYNSIINKQKVSTVVSILYPHIIPVAETKTYIEYIDRFKNRKWIDCTVRVRKENRKARINIDCATEFLTTEFLNFLKLLESEMMHNIVNTVEIFNNQSTNRDG